MDGTIRTKSFTLDPKAYARAMWTRGLLRPVLMFALCVVLLAVVFLAAGQSPMAVGALIGLVVALPVMVLIRYARFRTLGRNPDSRRLFDDPRTLAFSIEGLRVRTQSGIESQVPWSGITHVEERGGHLLLFMGRLQHFVVPESAFASSADREALRALLAAKGIETRVRKALG